jgi:S1-C subfamily serine protease
MIVLHLVRMSSNEARSTPFRNGNFLFHPEDGFMTVARCLVLASILFSSTALTARGDEPLSPETVQRLKDATVYVKTEIGPVALTGSGFVVQVTGDSALIVTNEHVIAKPRELRLGGYIPGLRGRDRLALASLQAALAKAEPVVSIVFNSGNTNEQVLKAEILGALDDPDLAVLKVSGIKGTPKPIEFRQGAQPVETMPLYLLGFPFGDALATNKGNPTITIGKGSVSSIRKDAAGKVAKVQIDGALNPGNSGGPVVDSKGNLVGIAVQTIQGSNIGLAIPPAELSGILDGRVGKPTIVAGTTQNGAAPSYEIVVPVIDPLNKLKSVSIMYVDGSVSVEGAKPGQPFLLSVAGSQKLDLPIKDRTARAAIPLPATANQKAREVTVQAAVVGDQGQLVHLDPLVVKVAAPVVVTTTKEGNSTTTTMTQKTPDGRTIKREVTITRGGGSGPSKMSKLKDDPAVDDADSADSPADKNGKSGGGAEKKIAEKDQGKSSGKTTELGWTNKITKMKKIPDDEITGTIDGIEFTPDKVTLSHGRLEFIKTPGFRTIFPEAEISFHLPGTGREDVSGKSLVVNGRANATLPTIVMKAMRKGDKIPKTQMHSDYCMILEFGQYDAKLRVQPGKIYICLPDRAKSFLVGSFEAAVDD